MLPVKNFVSVAKMASTIYETDNCFGDTTAILNSTVSDTYYGIFFNLLPFTYNIYNTYTYFNYNSKTTTYSTYRPIMGCLGGELSLRLPPSIP